MNQTGSRTLYGKGSVGLMKMIKVNKAIDVKTRMYTESSQI
jgi:hypothetical protein